MRSFSLLALALPTLLSAAPPTRLVGHELAEVRRWGRRLKVDPKQVGTVASVLEAHDPRRQELLRSALAPARRMDLAWGMMWNDQATLDAELPFLQERLSALIDHERTRLLQAAATLPDETFVRAATELERRARGEPRLPRKHAGQKALATALETAWAAYQLAEPGLAAALSAGVRKGWSDLQPLRKRWREVTDRIRAVGEDASEWELHRFRQELEALARDAEDVVAGARDEVLAHLDTTGRQGLAVSILRNICRLAPVVLEHEEVAELRLVLE